MTVPSPALAAAALAAALAALPVSAAGRPAAPAAAPASRPLVDALRDSGARVRPLGETGTLAGWLVAPADGSPPYSLYVAPSGHAVAGLLYGPEGALVTDGQLARLAPAETPAAPPPPAAETPPPALAAAALRTPPRAAVPFRQGLSDTLSFSLGSGPEVLVWADPTCPHSRSAVARIAREAARGRLRLTVVPVGVLGRAGVEASAGILAAPSPLRAWFGAAPPARVAPVAVQSVAWNGLLFGAWPSRAVPQIAWRDGAGRLRHMVGDVPDMPAWLRTLDPPEESGE